MTDKAHGIVIITGTNGRRVLLRVVEYLYDPHGTTGGGPAAVLNFRRACARAVGGFGYVMVYFETTTKNLRKLTSGHSEAYLRKELAKIVELERDQGLDPLPEALMPVVFIREASPLKPDERSPSHAFRVSVGFEHPDIPGTIPRITSALRKANIFVSQHDSVLRTTGLARKNARCAQEFMLYVPRCTPSVLGHDGMEIRKTDDAERAVREVLGGAFELPSSARGISWDRVSKTLSFRTPAADESLVPGSLPASQAPKEGSRVAYLTLVCANHEMGVLPTMVEFLTRPPKGKQKVYSIIRSSARSIGDWAVVVLCAVLPKAEITRRNERLASTIKDELKLTKDDILYARVFERKELPWLDRQLLGRASHHIVRDDRPGFLMDFIEHLYRTDYQGQKFGESLDIVQYDAWSQPMGEAKPAKCEHAFGLLHDGGIDPDDLSNHLRDFL